MRSDGYLDLPDATWAALHHMATAHALNYDDDMPHLIAVDEGGEWVVTYEQYDLFVSRGWVWADEGTAQVTGWGREMLRRWEMDVQRRMRRARA